MAPDALLADTLAIAVPLWLRRWRMVGGPADSDWEWAQEFAWVLGSEGDKLLFKGEKKGQTAKLFNDLACAISIMAYAPGGCTVFGRHWEAKAL
jgi:hypothetical protein